MSLLRGVIAVLALGLVVIALAAIAFVKSYEPLEWAGGGVGADARHRSYYGRFARREVDGAERTEYVFRHRAGQTFRFGVDVYNSGRFSVRIEGIEATSSGALQVVGLEVQPKPNWKVFKGVRTTPYDLKPGDYVFLVPRLRSGPTCGPEGASQTIDTIRLRYSYLRVFERVQEVELPMLVTQACGDPKVVVAGLSPT